MVIFYFLKWLPRGSVENWLTISWNVALLLIMIKMPRDAKLLISTFFDTCCRPSPIENYRSLYITRTKHYLMFLANIYKYIKWKKTWIAVTRLQISTLSRESKEIAAIQCSDLLSSPVCWQNYLVDILRKTIGKIIWTHFPEISLMYNSSYRLS